ncbi:MAG: PilN domain-containing protein [Desulfosarcina sp.]|nr:PilN domain-containing protein [Desulfobacterales bacterium]
MMVFDQINLTTRERIDYRIRFMLFGGIAALVLIISVINLYKGYQAYRERAAYQDKIEQLQQQALKLQAAEKRTGQVSDKAYQTLMNKSLRINHLIALDLFPWVKVLDALEDALPAVVVIDTFQAVDGFTRINLAGHTDSLEQLVQFQEGLEASDLFASVVLENMGLGGGSKGTTQPDSGRRMEFKLHCRLQLDKVFPEEAYGSLWLTLKKAQKTQ